MKNIYSLKDDARSIKMIQEATLNTKKYGIVSEYGLFGSAEWWNAIDKNDMEVFTLEGVISKVYMSGHNDFPEFKITSDGNITSWERKGDEKKYKEGSEVKLEYVQTKSKFNHQYSPTILNVWVS